MTDDPTAPRAEQHPISAYVAEAVASKKAELDEQKAARNRDLHVTLQYHDALKKAETELNALRVALARAEEEKAALVTALTDAAAALGEIAHGAWIADEQTGHRMAEYADRAVKRADAALDAARTKG